MPNIMGAAKAVLRGNFMAIITYIKKIERLTQSNIIGQRNIKKNQVQPKVSIRK